MATKNDITGDTLATKSATDAYREGYDRIFGKKEESVESKWERMTNPKTVEDYAVSIPISELTTAMIGGAAKAVVEALTPAVLFKIADDEETE